MASYTSFHVENEEEIISTLRTGMRDHSRQITIRFTAHTERQDVIKEMADHWIEEALKETDNPTEGDYIRYQYGGYEIRYSDSPSKNKYDYTVKIIPDYYTYYVEEEEVTEEIHRILESFSFDEHTSEIEKVQTIYQYVYDNVSYDNVHKDKSNNHMKTTAYSALFYHTAVCQGYSVLLYRMFREAGLSARVITGMAHFDDQEEYHAWNIVGIDGVYYNLDATWDKSYDTQEHFLKSDAEFTDHVRDEQFCTAEFYEHYPMAAESYR